MFCTRCNKYNRKILFPSVFNEEQICVSCKEAEEKHPLYKKAIKAHYDSEIKGYYDFKGIGLPKDLE